MIKHSTNRIWKGNRVEQGDPVIGAEHEKQALLECGQAYEEIEKPNSSNLKAEIVDYLEAESIEYESSMTKDELLDLI